MESLRDVNCAIQDKATDMRRQRRRFKAVFAHTLKRNGVTRHISHVLLLGSLSRAAHLGVLEKMFTLPAWKKMSETLRNAADRSTQDDFIALASNNGGDLDQISAWYKVFVVLNTAQREAESSYASLSDLWGAYENSHRAIAELCETDFINDDDRDEVVRIINKFQLRYFNPITALAVVIDPRLGFVTEILEPMFDSKFLRTECAENPYVSCTRVQLAWQGMLYFTCRMDGAGVRKCRNALNLILDRGLCLFEQDYLLMAPDTHQSLWWRDLVRTKNGWKNAADPMDACSSARAEEREAMDYFITNVAEK
eukprot:1526220-Rhodomonas_salina.1